ncbi:hypothetical protein ACHAXS_014414 [Conticribra weissflogii]
MTGEAIFILISLVVFSPLLFMIIAFGTYTKDDWKAATLRRSSFGNNNRDNLYSVVASLYSERDGRLSVG